METAESEGLNAERAAKRIKLSTASDVIVGSKEIMAEISRIHEILSKLERTIPKALSLVPDLVDLVEVLISLAAKTIAEVLAKLETDKMKYVCKLNLNCTLKNRTTRLYDEAKIPAHERTYPRLIFAWLHFSEYSGDACTEYVEAYSKLGDIKNDLTTMMTILSVVHFLCPSKKTFSDTLEAKVFMFHQKLAQAQPGPSEVCTDLVL